MTHADLPAPVVPATSRWGILARSAPIARPAMSLPSHTVSGDQSGRRLLEDVAEVDDPPARVGDLDADRLLAGDRRQDADVGGGQRVGQVVLELGDLGHLDPGRQADLVAGDVRAGDPADHLGLDPEVAERLEQRAARPAPARRCRAWPPRRSSGSGSAAPGTRQHEVGVVGDRGAVAALRREVLGVDARRRPAPPAPSSSSGSARSSGSELGLGGVLELELGASARRRRSAAPRRGWRGRSARRCPARAAAAARRRRSTARRAPARRRGAAAVGGPAARRSRPGPRSSAAAPGRCRRRRAPVGPDHAGQRRAGDQDQPGDEQEHGQDVGADGGEQVRGDPELGLAEDPAAGLERRRAPERRARAPARAEPERAGGQRQRQRGDQADRPGAQRPRGRAQLADQDQRPGRRPAPPGRRSRARRTRTASRCTAPSPSAPPAQCR